MLCLKPVVSQSRDSLGGPIEIAYREGYYAHFLLLGLRFLVAGVVVLGVIGLLAYDFLRWRHSGEQAPPIGPSLLLPILVTWAWGLLAVVAYSNPQGIYKQYYVVAMTLLQVGLVIVAARIGYHQGGTIKQPLNASTR